MLSATELLTPTFIHANLYIMKTIQVGDILYSTFGYNARLATFWKVLKHTEKSVTMARLIDNSHTGDWSDGTTAPLKNSRHGEVIRKKVKIWYDYSKEFVEDGFGCAKHWDGEPIKTYNHH